MPGGRASLTFESFFLRTEKFCCGRGLKISRASWLVSVWGNDSFRGVTYQPSVVVAAGSWDTDHGKPLPIFRGAPSTDLQQQVAPPSFQHASSPTTLTKKSRSAAAMKGSTWLPANASSKRQTQSRSRKRSSDGWAGQVMNFYSHSDGG